MQMFAWIKTWPHPPKRFTSDLFAVLAAAAPQLQRLDHHFLGMAEYYETVEFPADLGRLSQLTSLTLDLENVCIGATEVGSILGKLPRLQHLSLSYLKNKNEEGLSGIFSNCGALENLRIKVLDVGDVGAGSECCSARGPEAHCASHAPLPRPVALPVCHSARRRG